MSKKLIAIIALISLSVGVTGCSNNTSSNSNLNETVVSSENNTNVDTTIVLGDTTTVEGNGVILENNKVIIKSAGTYSISGTLSDGQLVVEAGDVDNVSLILNGVNINCSNSYIC